MLSRGLLFFWTQCSSDGLENVFRSWKKVSKAKGHCCFKQYSVIAFETISGEKRYCLVSELLVLVYII